jgi:hypothetical protein
MKNDKLQKSIRQETAILHGFACHVTMVGSGWLLIYILHSYLSIRIYLLIKYTVKYKGSQESQTRDVYTTSY